MLNLKVDPQCVLLLSVSLNIYIYIYTIVCVYIIYDTIVYIGASAHVYARVDNGSFFTCPEKRKFSTS